MSTKCGNDKTFYRFGFNGKEQDPEFKGKHNVQDYGFRMNDTRYGRFFTVDPLYKEYPYYSPYHFAGNNPLKYIDLDGLEPAVKELYLLTRPLIKNERAKQIYDGIYRNTPSGMADAIVNKVVAKVEEFKKDPIVATVKTIYESTPQQQGLSVVKSIYNTGENAVTGKDAGAWVDLAVLVFPAVLEAKVVALEKTAVNISLEGVGLMEAEIMPSKMAGSGAYRAAEHAKNWQSASLKETVKNVAGESPIVKSNPKTGKTIYENPKKGNQVVYDNAWDYFRIEDTKLDNAKDRYLNLKGERYNNNSLKGKDKVKDYENNTHFKNSDK